MICTLDHTTVQLIMCESGRYKYKFMVYERCLREGSCGIDEESMLNGMIHTSLMEGHPVPLSKGASIWDKVKARL